MGSALYQRIRASGKIKYGFCYGKTYRETKEKVNKCKAALVNGKPIPDTNSRHRFSFYCDEWLRIRCRDFLHIHVLRDLCDPYSTGPHQVQAQQRQVLFRPCFCKRMSNTPRWTGNCPQGRVYQGENIIRLGNGFILRRAYRAFYPKAQARQWLRRKRRGGKH